MQTVPALGPGGHPGARRVAGHRGPHHARHLPRVLDLPAAAPGPRPHARRHAGRSASRPGPGSSGSSTCSTRPRTWSSSRAPPTCPSARGEVELRRRHVRLPALGAGARRVQPAGGARRDGGAGGRVGVGQVDGVPAAAAVLRRPVGRRSRIDGVDVRDVTLDSLRRKVGRGVRGQLPVLRHDPGQHGLRPARRDRRGGARGRPAGPGPTSSSRRCPRATTRSSASEASRCRAASASASPWPVPCSPTPRSWCSTTPPRRSTAGPRRRSTRRSATSCGAAPPSSSPTGVRRCTWPTASPCSTAAEWSTSAPTTS